MRCVATLPWSFCMAAATLEPGISTERSQKVMRFRLRRYMGAISSLVEELEDSEVQTLWPDSPTQPYTLAGGMLMPIWYDRTGLPPSSVEQTASVERSVEQLMSLLEEVRGLMTWVEPCFREFVGLLEAVRGHKGRAGERGGHSQGAHHHWRLLDGWRHCPTTGAKASRGHWRCLRAPGQRVNAMNRSEFPIQSGFNWNL